MMCPHCGGEIADDCIVCCECGAALADEDDVLVEDGDNDADLAKTGLPYFDDSSTRGDGLSRVRVHGKFGYTDRDGIEVVPAIYEWTTYFTSGLAPVRLNGKYGYVDSRGTLAIPPVYDDACLFTEYDHALVRRDGDWGLIDTAGNMVTPAPWETGAFEIDLRPTEVDGSWGYLRRDEMVIRARYDDACSYSDGRAAVRIGDKWGYIDSNGYMVVAVMYDVAHPFSEGRAAVRSGDRWCYIDIHGASVVPANRGAESPIPLLKPIELGNMWGYADADGVMIIPAVYKRADTFRGDRARVRVQGDRKTRSGGLSTPAGTCRYLPCMTGLVPSAVVSPPSESAASTATSALTETLRYLPHMTGLVPSVVVSPLLDSMASGVSSTLARTWRYLPYMTGQTLLTTIVHA
jgi:hypothetical protein